MAAPQPPRAQLFPILSMPTKLAVDFNEAAAIKHGWLIRCADCRCAVLFSAGDRGRWNCVEWPFSFLRLDRGTSKAIMVGNRLCEPNMHAHAPARAHTRRTSAHLHPLARTCGGHQEDSEHGIRLAATARSRAHRPTQRCTKVCSHARPPARLALAGAGNGCYYCHDYLLFMLRLSALRLHRSFAPVFTVRFDPAALNLPEVYNTQINLEVRMRWRQ